MFDLSIPVVLTLSLGTASFLYVRAKRSSGRSFSDIPYVPLVPTTDVSALWGHEYLVYSAGVAVKYVQWASSVSRNFRIKAALFQKDIVVLTDSAAANHILQNIYRYDKSAAFKPVLARVVGRGLLWADGEEHKQLRKAVTPAFTSTVIRNMADDIYRCNDEFVEHLVAEVQEGSKTVNMLDYSTADTIELFAHTGFGEALPFESSLEFRRVWQADQQALAGFTGFLAPKLIESMPFLAKLANKETFAKKMLTQIARRLVKDVEEGRRDIHVQENGEARKDFFSLLMRNAAHTLSSDEIVDNVVTFFITGFAATAHAIALTLFELARNPACQETLREELRDVNVYDWETLDKLPYLDAVVREGLRLHPAGPEPIHVAMEDDVLPLHTPIELTNGKTVTSLRAAVGDKFILPVLSINTIAEIWGPDGGSFNPDRWLKGSFADPGALPHGPYSNILSFLDGPRVCIGWRLGIMEAKIAIAQVVKKLQLSDKMGAKIEKRLINGVTPFVDGVAGQVPVHVSLL